MRIAIVGPLSRDEATTLLDVGRDQLPIGYPGAPFLSTLASRIEELDHEVSFVTTSVGIDSPISLSSKTRKIEVTFVPQRSHSFRFNGMTPGRSLDFFRQERKGLCRALSSCKPDIVNAHWTYEFALAAIESGFPNLITCHDVPRAVLRYDPTLYRGMRYFMARRVFSLGENFSAVSPYLKGMLPARVRARCKVIPNPIPALAFIQPERTSQPDRETFVSVSNGWDERKNMKVALSAFAQLRKSYPAARLKIYGQGYEKGGVAHRWAVSNSCEAGVEFCGRVPLEVIIAELQSATAFLHPSKEETFGVSIVEALSLGTPAIAGRQSGAVPWVTEHAACVLVDVSDVDAVCSAMRRFLAARPFAKGELSRSREMIRNRFGPLQISKSYVDEYVRIVAEGR